MTKHLPTPNVTMCHQQSSNNNKPNDNEACNSRSYGHTNRRRSSSNHMSLTSLLSAGLPSLHTVTNNGVPFDYEYERNNYDSPQSSSSPSSSPLEQQTSLVFEVINEALALMEEDFEDQQAAVPANAGPA